MPPGFPPGSSARRMGVGRLWASNRWKSSTLQRSGLLPMFLTRRGFPVGLPAGFPPGFPAFPLRPHAQSGCVEATRYPF